MVFPRWKEKRSARFGPTKRTRNAIGSCASFFAAFIARSVGISCDRIEQTFKDVVLVDSVDRRKFIERFVSIVVEQELVVFMQSQNTTAR